MTSQASFTGILTPWMMDGFSTFIGDSFVVCPNFPRENEPVSDTRDTPTTILYLFLTIFDLPHSSVSSFTTTHQLQNFIRYFCGLEEVEALLQD
jgi:hypothetical protein